MTILTLSRTFKVSGKEKDKIIPDYESISKPSCIKKIIPTGFIKNFVKKFNLTCDLPEFDRKEIYLSNKAGPSGKATTSAMKSILSYTYPAMNSLFKITSNSGVDFFTEQYQHA
jgi:hypothetical protein